MTTEVTYLGTTDDCTTCECCGRKDLKSTVALSLDGGDPVHFGSECAARALGRSVKEVRSESRKADRAKEEAAAEAARKAEAAKAAPWFTFLAACGTGSDNFTRIESLGGYKAARERFAASPRRSTRGDGVGSERQQDMIRILIEEDCTACGGKVVPAGSDPLVGLLFGKQAPCAKCRGEKVARRSLTLAELAEMFHISTTYRTDNRPPESRILAKYGK